MKTRYVTYTSPGHILVVGIHMIERANNNLKYCQDRILILEDFLADGELDDKSRAINQAELDELNLKLPGLQAEADRMNACESREVKDTDWALSGCPEWWVNDNNTIRKPTTAEMDQRDADYEAAALADRKDQLYKSAMAYQVAHIDPNLRSEMDKSESVVESGGATEADLPAAKANGEWLESLWASYYAEKTKLEAGEEYSADFSGLGNVPKSFADVRTERKTYLAAV